MKKLIIILISISIIACSLKVTTKLTKTYPTLDYKDEVIVLWMTEKMPASATEIGVVKIDDSGFSTNCGWDIVIELTKMEARKAGGNVVNIIEHIPPGDMGYDCDRMTAKIFKVENSDYLNKLQVNKTSYIDSTWNYAKLFVYRRSGTGELYYNLYSGDSMFCKVKNNSKQEIKITKKGMIMLWAQTGAKEEVHIDIEFGREYYLRCSVEMGIMKSRPKLQMIDRISGKLEYNSIKNK